jgi:hypothetical protein
VTTPISVGRLAVIPQVMGDALPFAPGRNRAVAGRVPPFARAAFTGVVASGPVVAWPRSGRGGRIPTRLPGSRSATQSLPTRRLRSGGDATAADLIATRAAPGCWSWGGCTSRWMWWKSFGRDPIRLFTVRLL